MKTSRLFWGLVYAAVLVLGPCAFMTGCNRLAPSERQEIRQETRVETRTENRMDRRRSAIKKERRD